MGIDARQEGTRLAQLAKSKYGRPVANLGLNTFWGALPYVQKIRSIHGTYPKETHAELRFNALWGVVIPMIDEIASLSNRFGLQLTHRGTNQEAIIQRIKTDRTYAEYIMDVLVYMAVGYGHGGKSLIDLKDDPVIVAAFK